MSLILKSDVKYTGVARAKHLLEYLSSPSMKSEYIKSMLSDIGADHSYVTDTNSDALTQSLLAHLDRVSKLGASALSLNYTLKALVFIMQNGLQTDDYTAISADFGVSIDANGDVLVLHTLDASLLNFYTFGKLKTLKFGLQNVLATADSFGAALYSSKTKRLGVGLITGYCVEKTDFIGSSEPIRVKDSVKFNIDMRLTPRLSRVTNASNLAFAVQTSQSAASPFKYVESTNPDEFNKAGVVSKYEYGTANNKVFVSGEEKISNSGTDIMYDLSALAVRVGMASGSLGDGFIEGWVINSKDNSLANALSIHLNRQ